MVKSEKYREHKNININPPSSRRFGTSVGKREITRIFFNTI